MLLICSSQYSFAQKNKSSKLTEEQSIAFDREYIDGAKNKILGNDKDALTHFRNSLTHIHTFQLCENLLGKFNFFLSNIVRFKQALNDSKGEFVFA